MGPHTVSETRRCPLNSISYETWHAWYIIILVTDLTAIGMFLWSFLWQKCMNISIFVYHVQLNWAFLVLFTRKRINLSCQNTVYLFDCPKLQKTYCFHFAWQTSGAWRNVQSTFEARFWPSSRPTHQRAMLTWTSPSISFPNVLQIRKNLGITGYKIKDDRKFLSTFIMK